MKRNHVVWLLLAAFLAVMLTGCGATEPVKTPAPADASTVTEQAPAAPKSTESVGSAQETEEQTDYLSVYAPVLDQICDVLYNGLSEDMDNPLVASGIVEMAMWMERSELLQNIGYTMMDISGDGIPELLVGTVVNTGTQAVEKSVVLSGYTCKDGEPACFLDGYTRSSYQWLGDGRFYYFGSGGAAYSAFGTYHILPDGTDLQCENFYFSDTRDSDISEVVYYHNTTGAWDKAAAEEINISSDAFWALSDDCSSEYRALELTPFADYPYAGYIAQPLACKVRADYYEDVSGTLIAYEDGSDYFPAGAIFDTKVVFRCEEDIKDFKVLSLNLLDVDASGHASFDIHEQYTIATLHADKPLVAPMSFPGDLPSNGFSYTDTDGTTKTFAINISGKDGSLVIEPLD